MSRNELVFDMCGLPKLGTKRLNDDPPSAVLNAVLARTALTPAKFDRMHSLGGIKISPSETILSYLTDQSILAPGIVVPDLMPLQARPWVSGVRRMSRLHCPACSEQRLTNYDRLWWRLPFISSCPEHGVLLTHRSARTNGGSEANDVSENGLTAIDALVELDRKTVDGLTDGAVAYCGRRIPIGRWVQLLRILVNELCYYGAAPGPFERGVLEEIWDRACTKRPQRRQRPAQIETMRLIKQQQVMTAVAVALRMLARGEIHGDGNAADMLNKRAEAYRPKKREVYQATAATRFREISALPFDERFNGFLSTRSNPPVWRAVAEYMGLSMKHSHFSTSMIVLDLCTSKAEQEGFAAALQDFASRNS